VSNNIFLCGTGFADAYGTVRYFNVSKTTVRRGESIVLHCGATLDADDGGQLHSLVLHIRKWFQGSRQFLLAVNEDLEVMENPLRYQAQFHRIDDIQEVQFTIFGKNSARSDRRLTVCQHNVQFEKWAWRNNRRWPIGGVMTIDMLYRSTHLP